MNFSNFISIVGVCVFVGILFKNNNFLSWIKNVGVAVLGDPKK
jgi:hypothetical protein